MIVYPIPLTLLKPCAYCLGEAFLEATLPHQVKCKKCGMSGPKSNERPIFIEDPSYVPVADGSVSGIRTGQYVYMLQTLPVAIAAWNYLYERSLCLEDSSCLSTKLSNCLS